MRRRIMYLAGCGDKLFAYCNDETFWVRFVETRIGHLAPWELTAIPDIPQESLDDIYLAQAKEREKEIEK